uniref:Uncharacterized protein n=1 Tax=Graphocephala atropunctata TaxID=36148 RepID=A0A1B6MDN4_9HEMI
MGRSSYGGQPVGPPYCARSQAGPPVGRPGCARSTAGPRAGRHTTSDPLDQSDQCGLVTRDERLILCRIVCDILVRIRTRFVRSFARYGSAHGWAGRTECVNINILLVYTSDSS